MVGVHPDIQVLSCPDLLELLSRRESTVILSLDRQSSRFQTSQKLNVSTFIMLPIAMELQYSSA
jgi:hypothetical protein